MSVLRDELLNDPLAWNYGAMTDSEAAAKLNDATLRDLPRSVIDTWEILDATVPSEYATLTANQRQTYQIIISSGQVSIASTNIRNALAAMFGAGTATRANLLALQTRKGSRAEELGLGRVKPGHIQMARG